MTAKTNSIEKFDRITELYQVEFFEVRSFQVGEVSAIKILSILEFGLNERRIFRLHEIPHVFLIPQKYTRVDQTGA